MKRNTVTYLEHLDRLHEAARLPVDLAEPYEYGSYVVVAKVPDPYETRDP